MAWRAWLATRVSIAAVLLVVLAAPVALAQTDDQEADSATAFGVTVSPVVDEFVAKPGTKTERSVKITNPVQEVISLYPVTLNFGSSDDKGLPSFYSLEERNSKFAITEWISFSRPLVRIAPGEIEEFTYTITIPEDAEPGGHYGAVLFSTKPPAPPKVSTDNKVSVVGLVGTLVLGTVSGELKQVTDISDFTAPTVLVKPPANFSLTFKNTGNVHAKPVGEIKIRNMFGQTVTALKVNEGKGAVLPESSRKFENTWSFGWGQVGKYTATAVIAYGTPEQNLTSVRTFYVFPIWLIIALAVLALWVIIKLFRRHRARRQTPPPPPVMPTSPPPSAPTPKPPRFVMR